MEIINLVILVLFVLSVTLNIITLLKFKRINQQSELFFAGKNGKDLEELIENQKTKIENIDKEIQRLFEASEKIYKLSNKGIHKVGLIRYNPFKDIGGDQSFALAFLNGKDTGVTISSLHTREGTRIYAKSIKNGVTDKYKLTEEEEKAIQIAQTTKKID